MFLTSYESNLLQPITNMVQNTPVSDLVLTCQKISQELHCPNFPFTFTGIHCGLSGRISDACTLLELDSKNSFSASLKNYLIKFGKFTPQSLPFSDSRPFNVWLKSSFYKEYTKQIVSHVLDVSKQYLTEAPEEPAIVDIGPGNGVLLSLILNSLVESHKIKKQVLP